MSKVRWTLSLVVALVAACGAPTTALAPSQHTPSRLISSSVRSITQIGTELLGPLGVQGLAAAPLRVVRSESGELRLRQLLLRPGGVEAVRVESTLDGSIRLVAVSDVALESAPLNESAAIAYAIRHLARLGISMPPGRPTICQIAGRTLVIWDREVRAVPVLDDGIRVVLNGVGALVGVSIEESPLAAAPPQRARADAALRAATALLPIGAELSPGVELAWVLPSEADGSRDEPAARRLAWCLTGKDHGGAAFALYLDAGSLTLLRWDGAP